MEERNVLSPEEVEAIIQAAKTSSSAGQAAPAGDIDGHHFNVIVETVREELAAKLTILLKKKILVKHNPVAVSKLEDCLKQANEKNVYASFKLTSHQSAALIGAEANFLDVFINFLYGGKGASSNAELVSGGKIALITTEKVGKLLLDCLADASKEYGEVTHENYRASHLMENANIIPEGESIHAVEFIIMFDEIETKLTLYLPEEFLIALIPKIVKGQKEKDFWRSAIKSEVVDSYVTVNTVLDDVVMKVKDFMNLKEGDEFLIPDPTAVFVCLNDLKLFKAVAGQSNSKIVAKIVQKI